ncbi:Uncharacterized protein TCM_007089 [Theobroma cacao]|uniref:Uncharacterized protein n=1 Tax=Theobroma cacao TaxID=3641 RepID=A0A061DZU4_THECC|nr:Uncharacterized protein TCM_007089 [Theobroma cacao]
MFMLKIVEDELGLGQALIQSFDHERKPVFHFTNAFGHCPWDINCNCEGCPKETFETDYEPNRVSAKRSRKKKQSCSDREMYRKYQDKDPSIRTLGEDEGKYQYLVKYSLPKWAQPKQNLSEPSS